MTAAARPPVRRRGRRRVRFPGQTGSGCRSQGGAGQDRVGRPRVRQVSAGQGRAPPLWPPLRRSSLSMCWRRSMTWACLACDARTTRTSNQISSRRITRGSSNRTSSVMPRPGKFPTPGVSSAASLVGRPRDRLAGDVSDRGSARLGGEALGDACGCHDSPELAGVCLTGRSTTRGAPPIPEDRTGPRSVPLSRTKVRSTAVSLSRSRGSGERCATRRPRRPGH